MERPWNKEPYEVIERKLQLAELTIELGHVTREKWKRLATMKDVLTREEDLLRQIAELTTGLQNGG
jgi:hypothetical protein